MVALARLMDDVGSVNLSGVGAHRPSEPQAAARGGHSASTRILPTGARHAIAAQGTAHRLRSGFGLIRRRNCHAPDVVRFEGAAGAMVAPLVGLGEAMTELLGFCFI